jgi:hemoglobin
MPRLLLHVVVIVLLGLGSARAAEPTPPRDPSIPDPAPAHPELKPVFEAFGGVAGIRALMEDFMVILLADPRTAHFFAESDNERVKEKLTEQICAILGGGCEYTGMDMVEAHAGHLIRRADFNALVENLQIAMDGRGIPNRAQNRLLARLAPMHREVVNDPPREEY